MKVMPEPGHNSFAAWLPPLALSALSEVAGGGGVCVDRKER